MKRPISISSLLALVFGGLALILMMLYPGGPMAHARLVERGQRKGVSPKAPIKTGGE